MRYFKSINNNYIIGVGIGNINTEIDQVEYDRITEIIRNKPSAESGYDYRLRADTLEWELVEVPAIDEQPEDDEITAEEALEIIRGGVI